MIKINRMNLVCFETHQPELFEDEDVFKVTKYKDHYLIYMKRSLNEEEEKPRYRINNVNQIERIDE